MQTESLKDFLLINSLIDKPNKLEMDLTKLLEKDPFMKLIKDSVTKETCAQETKNLKK